MRRSTYPERDYQFGQRILILRTESNLTQSRLAELLGVSRQTVVGWETGASYPSPGHLKHLIKLGLQHGGFHRGQEGDEIRLLWQSAKQRVPMDEIWLTHLLEKPNVSAQTPKSGAHVDWGDAPDVSNFYGREPELAILTEWLLAQHCRVVSLLGMGGIGKTMLAAKLVEEVSPRFERVYWRSLRDAPTPDEWLAGAIGFLSEQQVVPPAAESERLAAFLGLLRTRRCLLVLDNFETLFEPGQAEGVYRSGLAGYGRLLRAIGEASHQSCLVLTSREAPAELTVLGGEAVRIFPLGGLGVNEARQLLAAKELVGTNEQWVELTGRFGGNGLALKLVGERIHELFDGEIGLYIEEAGAGSIFGGIRQLLDEQVGRSSAPEQQVLRVLAVAREPVRLVDLLSVLGERLGRGAVLEAVEALRRRSLVERAEVAGAAALTLQSVVLEYVTDRLVEEVVAEVERGVPVLLVEQALVQAQIRDYVRQTQERLIGAAILERLKIDCGRERTEQQLLKLLEGWRGRPAAEQGYGPGNVVNLLRLLRGDLKRLDLSRLAIRQAYLAEVDAQDTRLVDAHLAEAVLADAFSLPLSVALSKDGKLLAAGMSTGEVWLWRVADRTLLAALEGHTGMVRGVALSADGELLVSGGADGTVRLWATDTGELLAALQGHTGAIYSVALSADGHLLASGGGDGTVRLWETDSGELLATVQGHTGTVYSVALSTNGELLASGGGDGTVRLWETDSGELLAALQGHTGAVYSVAISAEGHLLASGGGDGTVRLWETDTGELLATVQGHTGAVYSVALSADGELVASGGTDGTVRLWETDSGRPLATVQGHTSMVWRVALSADGHLLASGDGNGTVRLWETGTRRPLATLQGHTSAVWGVALSADGHLLASSGGNGTVRLWETGTRRPVATLQGHTSGAWSVALAGNVQLLASGGGNGTVRLWATDTGELLATLQGHTGVVWGVALSADGRLLASGGGDETVRLWETSSGRPLATLQGHTGGVWSAALSSNGELLVSGGGDGTVRLWETGSGELLAALQGHTGVVYGVALSADGHLLASGGVDGTVRLWETGTRRPLATLQGHTGVVRGVGLSADGELVASGGVDGTVRLWEASTGRPLATLQGDTGGVYSVGLSADGELVASGGTDGTVRLWETDSGRPLATVQGHTGVVWAVALSADGHLLASGGVDGTVRLWDTRGGAPMRTLRAERHYERMDITGLTGITEVQRQAMLALGAVEDEASTSREQIVQR